MNIKTLFHCLHTARVEFEAAELTVREMAMSVNVCVIVTQGSVSDSGGRVTLVSAGLSATGIYSYLTD